MVTSKLWRYGIATGWRISPLYLSALRSHPIITCLSSEVDVTPPSHCLHSVLSFFSTIWPNVQLPQNLDTVQVPVHMLPTPAQTGLTVKGSDGRPTGTPMSPETGYVQSVPDWLGREQSAISSFKPRLQICRRLPMILKFRDGTWPLSKCYCNLVLRNIYLKLPYGMDSIQISKAWHAPSSQVLLIRHLIVSTCSNRSSKKQQREQQQQDEQFGTGREDLARFSWAQPTYTAVQPTNVFSFQMWHSFSNSIKLIAKNHW